jgi:hypothetical protein
MAVRVNDTKVSEAVELIAEKGFAGMIEAAYYYHDEQQIL